MSASAMTEDAASDVSRPVLTRQDSKTGGVDSRFCCNICFEAVVEPVVTQCGHLYCWPCLYRWLEPGMQPEERLGLGMLRRLPSFDSSRRVCPVCKAPCSVPTLVPIYVRSLETTPPKREEARGDEAEHWSDELREMETRIAEDGSGTNSANENNQELGSHSQTTGDDASDLALSGSITGLRQRLRFRSRDSEIPAEEDVPSRPAANSPSRTSPPPPSTPQTPQTYRTNNWMTPLSPNGHRGSLSHGLLLSFQQATANGVPPLHRREGAYASELDAHPDATEYLSRLLIMLASFVILCLLLL
jgi:hypothetical protein